MAKKNILATLASLMLVGVLAGSILGTVVAYTPPGGWPPGQPYFTLYAMISSDLPYATWTGGYHDVMYEVQRELAKIGINLEIRMYDSWTIWSTCWEEKYNVSSVDALPPNGWDITTSDWWISSTSTIWVESFCERIWTPPLGYNIMSWTNEEADELLRAGIYTLDAEERKDNLWDWQRLFMHDPPMINLFYPSYYDVTGSYVKGWSAEVWFSTVDYFALDVSKMSDARKGMGQTTFYLGCSVDMPNVMSLYMSGYTSSGYSYATQDSLYVDYRDYDQVKNEFVGPWKIRPMMAADFPTYLDYTTLVIPLRDDVYWVWANGSKSEKFDAYDVKFSIDTVLDPATGSPSQGEFMPAIESVEVLSNATLEALGLLDVAKCMYEPYAVQINLKAPFGDILEIISMHWGAGMLPEHLLGDIPKHLLRTSLYYYKPELWCFTGPYLYEDWRKGEYVKLKANPHYYGRKMTGIVDEVYMEIVPDDATRMAMLKTNQVDGVEFTWAPVEEINDWKQNYPNLHVMKYEAPQSNNIIFNLNNPYLSNRYVRMAIAHAIPYEHIYEVIQGWGIDTVYPGKASIVPHCMYTEPDVPGDPDLTGSTVSLFNEDDVACPPYTYNITLAQMYMDMWRYSQVDKDYTLGPVGDGDFSGYVEVDDYVVWANAIVKGTLTSDTWVFPPGNDYDPDYDNTDYVELDDFYRWRENSGMWYPERSIWQEVVHWWL